MGTAEFGTACPLGPWKTSVGVPLTPIFLPPCLLGGDLGGQVRVVAGGFPCARFTR